MKWEQGTIILKNRESETAQLPVIISASRSTDIAAFYADWFANRLKEGYLKWTNPFNSTSSYISFQQARLVVFWSKNPSPLIKHLPFIKEKIGNYYFQYTLNDYEQEGLEPHVPLLQTRIETFINLSEKVGKEKVIWRFDPLLLTDRIGIDDLLRKIEKIGEQIYNYTDKLVFSFADIEIYRKVQQNLNRNLIKYREFDDQSRIEIARGIQALNQKWNLEIASCAEPIDLVQFGIQHNKCIDDDLIIKLFSSDQLLMDFLGVRVSDDGEILKSRNLKDKGQREFCGCIWSKDIGSYNTCPYLCTYCYANGTKETVLKNFSNHNQNPLEEGLKGI
jgi:DNA repair photolyase